MTYGYSARCEWHMPSKWVSRLTSSLLWTWWTYWIHWHNRAHPEDSQVTLPQLNSENSTIMIGITWSNEQCTTVSVTHMPVSTLPLWDDLTIRINTVLPAPRTVTLSKGLVLATPELLMSASKCYIWAQLNLFSDISFQQASAGFFSIRVNRDTESYPQAVLQY